MPEGHSIHRIAHLFQQSCIGRTVSAVSPQGRFSESAKVIDGSVVTDAWAYGKHLFVRFDKQVDKYVLHVHLGLYGSWIFAGGAYIGAPRRIGDNPSAAKPGPNTRLYLSWGDGEFAALTGPTKCELIADAATVINRLGPDPISEDDPSRFVTSVRLRSTPIGALVMDQAVVAGPGNIYRAECLFRTGISPFRMGTKVSEKRLEVLWCDLVETMRQGVSEGKIVTRRVGGEPRHWVYKRQGEPCLRCGATVSLREVAGRKLYWCPGCQH